MRKILQIVLSCLAALLPLVAAAQAKTSIEGADIHSYEATELTNGANMFITPLVAELKIIGTEPRSHTMRQTITLPAMLPSESASKYEDRVEAYVQARVSELKSQILFELADKNNATLIVSPTYSISTESSRGQEVNVVVKVKGYPAVYTRFRNMMASDSTMIRMSRSIPNNVGRITEQTSTRVEAQQNIEEEVHIIEKERKKK